MSRRRFSGLAAAGALLLGLLATPALAQPDNRPPYPPGDEQSDCATSERPPGGRPQDCRAGGFQPASEVEVHAQSDGDDGWVFEIITTADDDGVVAFEIPIPEHVRGLVTVTSTGVDPGGAPVSVSASPFLVTTNSGAAMTGVTDGDGQAAPATGEDGPGALIVSGDPFSNGLALLVTVLVLGTLAVLVARRRSRDDVSEPADRASP